MKKTMLNGWIRWFSILMGVVNLACCIYNGCTDRWEVACCEFATSMVFLTLALYDWAVKRMLSVTRRRWFRNGWIQCQSTMDEKLLNRYRLLLQWKHSTTNPRVNEVNHIRCHTVYSLRDSLRKRMMNDNFEHYDYESKNGTEDS